MKWFYDLKISRKLISVFFIVVALEAALGAFAIRELGRVNQASTEIATNWLPSIRTLSQLKLSLARIRSFELQHILASTPQEFEEIERNADKQIAALAKQQRDYQIQISEPEEKVLFPDVEKALAVFLSEHKKILDVSRTNKNEDARTMLKGESTKVYRSLLDQVEKLVEVNEKGAEKSSTDADATYASARMWIIAMLLICMAAAMTLAIWISRVISRPLTEAVGVAQRVAGGDLTGTIRAESKDETGQLLEALRGMNDNLLKIVGEVRTGTDTIATASNEIASGNMDLSSRTEQQAGSLEETASAMEELTSTVKQNADNARQANQLAVTASEVAVAGGNVVGQVVDTMGSINDSSKKIVDIIGVIDGIAFQTNILALNAAVEAARAGEQGRGFAVVASEVRSLAQRSAAAAKEIKILIDDSVSKVDIGSKLVEQAGSTMEEVVNSVRRVTDIVSEITAASHEQSQGIEQINLAITQMDEVTQQNAALVEQAAAAAQSMQEQAGRLSEVVSVFKLDERAALSKPAAPKRTIDITPVRAPGLKSAKPAVMRKEARPALKSPTAANDETGSWEQF
ncbi:MULTISPECIES: methyl-accepting chemotaxis protein [unclassified Herbaspirillum]|uniref:methyl-accepting chemotaxis protein n=1 Tax=unclassified Herbaspirillum TaxID=2624150 RepID=UPI000E2E844E|nr:MULTISPECIES: methyl-accepting chemotaxis protein [unclassified Herbaspirillum]RFB69639.1 methyl-accepting chemotaxis protein [Herbaspirillum sp. 3R-3a1]TFI07298.1 methyl-accepting chemotaxis protein [Herbaspirillum sp. 3R11]TFI12073.1 methyl-accepting chemotaxis protein [Herbaspirillum sp. 3R-11]TFI29789.1 methyl-accepting chemotaxis protein [Herbaspirillum sp. 3C11]